MELDDIIDMLAEEVSNPFFVSTLNCLYHESEDLQDLMYMWYDEKDPEEKNEILLDMEAILMDVVASSRIAHVT